jgi:dTDP-4-amino-4,6-dideoxygalactose transaminase
VDIDEATYNMDPAKLEKYIETGCQYDASTATLIDKKTGARVAAILPVHLYGQMADMDRILEIAERYKLVVIEDACQAHGAEYFSKKQNRWCKAGSMGRAAAFSFYPGKNLGACGEGGALTTNDADLAQKARMIRDHGQAKKYYHDMEGYNGRLDAMQAGFLHVKLKQMPRWTEQRQAAAKVYGELFAARPEGVKTPVAPEWTKAVYHLYIVRLQDRDECIKHLGAAGIGSGIHYPIPLHLQKAYTGLGYKQGDFPVAEKVAVEILSIPMFPGLTPEQQKRVVESVASFVAGDRAAVARS